MQRHPSATANNKESELTLTEHPVKFDNASIEFHGSKALDLYLRYLPARSTTAWQDGNPLDLQQAILDFLFVRLHLLQVPVDADKRALQVVTTGSRQVQTQGAAQLAFVFGEFEEVIGRQIGGDDAWEHSERADGWVFF